MSILGIFSTSPVLKIILASQVGPYEIRVTAEVMLSVWVGRGFSGSHCCQPSNNKFNKVDFPEPVSPVNNVMKHQLVIECLELASKHLVAIWYVVLSTLQNKYYILKHVSHIQT